MRTYWFGTARRLSSLTALLLLTACGGGGGGGGDGGGPAPVVYGGNLSAAIVTSTNASKLTANVVGSSDTAAIILGVSIESGDATQGRGSGVMDLALRLNRTFRDTVLRANSAPRVTPGVQIDQTDLCNGGGSVRTFGTLSDSDGRGTLTVSFNNCVIDGVTLNGPGTLRVDAVDFSVFPPIPTDFTMTFARLTLRGPGLSIDAGGSLRAQLDLVTKTETITANQVSLNNNTGETTKTENLVIVSVYDNISFPTSLTANISGRVFDQVHGYVDVTTTAPLFFATLIQLFPDSGQMLLTGAGSSIRASAFSATLTRLELDLNGNSTYEIDARLKWTDLSGPVGSDLDDDDVDGMHNSWETANGLNPNDSADAVLDKDNDAASNLDEYLADTDPSDPGPPPPAVGLSISLRDSPDPATVGGNLTYTVTVSNSSSFIANNVVVADTLPAGVNLVSATPGLGSCTGTTSLVCNLGTLSGFGQATITIVVSPTAEGVVNNTASVTSSSFDPNLSDNSATSTTTVGQGVAGIQLLIDSASPDTTILVGPGTYFGGLNFNAKNITLQSSAGPASTIIHGNQGTAVRMGPGGAIKGFTITGSFASFGAGIEVHGQGSLISGNVFDGNAQGGGGFGAAIGGNSASPIIERNVFRNNTCDNQFPAGVVAFVNSSSPLIVNNIFENNQCRAINLTLPQGNAPQVVNNTFVGNRTAVRVDRQVPQTTQIFRNNVIVQNGIGLEIESGTEIDNPVWENNLVFGNTTNYLGTANLTGTNGNLSANPMFINAAGGNYRLQPVSPAIDMGNALGAPGVDFDGTLRPLDGNGDATAVVDMGAFEAPQIP